MLRINRGVIQQIIMALQVSCLKTLLGNLCHFGDWKTEVNDTCNVIQAFTSISSSNYEALSVVQISNGSSAGRINYHKHLSGSLQLIKYMFKVRETI